MRRLLAPSLILAATLAAASSDAATPKDALVMAWNLDALITLDPAQIAVLAGSGDIAPQQSVLSAAYAELARGFRLSFDHFGRSSSPQNHRLTQHFAGVLKRHLRQITPPEHPRDFARGEIKICKAFPARIVVFL